MVKRLVTLIAAIVLTGCAYSMSELKTESKNLTGKIESDKNYQEVYRTLLNMSKECLEHTSLSSEVTISGDLYHDIREGQIRQRLSGGGILIATSAIDIKALEDKRTEVTLYTVKSNWYGFGIITPGIDDVARWINGDRNCWIPAPKPD